MYSCTSAKYTGSAIFDFNQIMYGFCSEMIHSINHAKAYKNTSLHRFVVSISEQYTNVLLTTFFSHVFVLHMVLYVWAFS